MAFGITTYTDPGVYQQEVIVPSGINIPATPFAVCLVGTGSRNKRVANEQVIRGIVKGEALTPNGSSPHTAVLANRGLKQSGTTTVYKTLNGITSVVPQSFITFNPSFVLGTVTSTIDLTSLKAFAIEIDGVQAVTLVLSAIGASTSAGSPTFSAVVLNGREIHVTFTATTGSTDAAIPMSDIAAAVNTGLAAAGSLGLGSTFANVASTSAGALMITSAGATPVAKQDVRVFSAYADDAVTAIFGVSGASNRDAQTVLLISDLVWNSSATWKADYAALNDTQDPLLQTSNVQNIVSVGSSPGGTDFAQHVDWQLTSNQVDWNLETAAVLTGIAGAGDTYDVSTNNQLILGLDGLLTSLGPLSTDVVITLAGSPSSPPIGWANPGTPSAATSTELANNINAYLAAAFGPRYDAVASSVVVNGKHVVRLTSPTLGQFSSSIYVKAAASASADALLFGAGAAPQGHPAMGTGKRPAIGSAFYVTYDFTRPLTDYEVPMRWFSSESAIAQVGAPSASTAAFNPLGIASQLCFENGAQFIYTVQVNDTAEGNPTRAQVRAALDGAGTISGTTEIVVLDEPGTRLDVTVDEINHLETQNSPLEKHPRRIFCGMLNNTPIGDRDTVNSIVGRATRTLQVSPNSPGRGRMFMIAPPQQQGVTRDLTFEDGTTARVPLNGTYLGAAVAAARTALSGPAETLTRKTITGFNTDDITSAWKPAERRAMAGNGVLVVTYDAGRFIMLDAMSTEGGGGGLTAFQVDSTSYQKDIIVTKVNQALDANIVGVVPFDLATFLLDIKLVIQGVIAQEISRQTIGPYRDKSTGTVRPIDLRVDIRVEQDADVPTQFNFSYFFNLRYPALRLFGQYSVDNPFFAVAA